ncbi:glycyl-tRNA synthetase subunit beta [Salipiger aestuarii]|uniref:Glycine--tRNA ligase beta subunit n=1 Tax=Salipiger aestuarii TaxID=568098 RepID=A0A327Y6R4_9RHOB|nr:glycine--tRNA ligase subunit beta [Salipiger aestuarii]EIE52048.1 glycyl-tRNA synthetase subunit beta [Citreicella sp. 357]KAB2542067.1 glycyl-tRNA synthetase subunit beta [Salipiger aestuarii]RAK16494.1 glycyl-tRNA synthetase beta chain [Salipiger aestuarii]
MPDLLIELFSEEIPARMQTRAAEDLKKLVTDGLVESGLTYAGAAAFSTPRRLTLTLSGVLAASPATREERRGPRVDAPQKAIDGFLRGAGVARAQCEERADKKGTVLFAILEKPGRPAAEIVAEVLERTIRNFPWPKSMRWGAGSLRWVRPLHSILCLLSDEQGSEVVPLTVDGITAGRSTQGHRFMGSGAFDVTGFDDYEAKLKRARVILSATERADTIWHDATNRAFALGLEVVQDAGLLAEVAGLVEWPVVLMGRIGEDFLGLPPEVLQTSMKEHQKFFSVRNPATSRIEGFVTVANIETADDGATILAGNNKVLSARLSDAKFFWENDLRVAKNDGLEAWTERLANVTFHNKLGSQKDRIDRIAALAREIAPMVGADADLAEQAARVAKADLSSEMVFEFPELQGLMGRYYASAANLPTEVAAAAQDHYSPLGPSDDVPTAPVSVAVALADKLDTLTGFWAIDEKPTGSKDPFALRRAALGVIRLVLVNGIRTNLRPQTETALKKNILARDWINACSGSNALLKMSGFELFEDSLKDRDFSDEIGPFSDDLLSFLHDRLKVHLRDEGIRHDVIDAVLAMPGSDDLSLVVARARALSETLNTEDGANLVQGFRRANNILTQAEENDGVEYSFGADAKFAETPEETALFAALDAADAVIKPAMQKEAFGKAMSAMAGLRGPIDAFFEAVQVNSDNAVVRRNRLNLLSRIRTTCLQVADLTRLDG